MCLYVNLFLRFMSIYRQRKIFSVKSLSLVVNGSRTHRNAAIIFGWFKNENIDISIFLFYQNCKKCHFWQFIAPFGSQLRQMVFECLVRAVLFRTYSEFYSEVNSQEAYQICGSNTFHLPFFLAPSRCKTPFFFNSTMYFSIWQADIPHCSANCLAEMEASARMN